MMPATHETCQASDCWPALIQSEAANEALLMSTLCLESKIPNLAGGILLVLPTGCWCALQCLSNAFLMRLFV